ncbi:MAG TPA: FTR1 family protein [Vicinamibacteria bacterium]|jgi:high-affinity iron transporter
MKFIFNFAGVLLLLAPACTRTPTSPPAAEGSDAERVVALLDYVSGDYALNAKDGAPASREEYEEQLRFAGDARRLADGLLGPGAERAPLGRRMAEVEARVREQATPEAVAEACRAAREEAIIRFGLRTTPAERPSLARAQALYVESCAICHGPQGEADTERARLLDPPPARFRSPDRLRDLSPFRVYNSLTFGVPGTAMASFESLSPADRWNLAFYVLRLGHEGEPARGPVDLTLGELATGSDRDLLRTLGEHGQRDPPQALAYARQEAAFGETPAGIGLDRTRRMIRQARQVFSEGRAEDADRIAIDAYLQGYEPLEARLRARDPQATAAVEGSFRDLRAAISRGDAAAVEGHAQRLDRLLADGAAGRPLVPFAAAFVIFLREGLEAALLVGALLAGVRRLGRPDARRYVHAGWLAALPAGVATWWLFQRVVAVNADERELVEAGVALLAAAVLFSVSFWMISKIEARRWTGYLRRRLEESLNGRRLVLLAGLSFLAVYREAAETVLFTQALLLECADQRGHVWAGAAAGVLAVMAVALVMSRTVMRLPMGPFFAVSSALLCGLAISFAGAGIYDLVAAGYLAPRPVTFPEIPWMGIHPDLTGLVVQLTIVAVILGAAVTTLRRRPAEVVKDR